MSERTTAELVAALRFESQTPAMNVTEEAADRLEKLQGAVDRQAEVVRREPNSWQTVDGVWVLPQTIVHFWDENDKAVYGFPAGNIKIDHRHRCHSTPEAARAAAAAGEGDTDAE